MKKTQKTIIFTSLSFVLFPLYSCHAFENARMLDRTCTIVGESAYVMPTARAFCKGDGETQVADSSLKYRGKDTIMLTSSDKLRGISFEYQLAMNHPISERLRFWVKAERSDCHLKIACFHSVSKSWIELANVPLIGNKWMHLEIPASNPIYYYHPSITAFKFHLDNKEQGPQSLLVSGMELVSPVVVKSPLVTKKVPSPAFDTWGGPDLEQIRACKNIGTTIHLSPIEFFDKPVEQRVAYAVKSVKWLSDANIMPGIQFYNHPGKWQFDHLELFPKNQNDSIQRDGGTYTSPWNPEARRLWREHIIASLKELQKNNVLKYVKLVELCPGLESEVSYEWSEVWAFDEYAVKAYRQYLKEFYKEDVNALNMDWQSDFKRIDDITVPRDYLPDRAHWVFTDFYRLSMLRFCVFLADSVHEVFTPEYWLWMTHTIPDYPKRFYSARYPLFYAENLRRLGYLDYAQIAALDWHGIEDIKYLQDMGGLKVIGEIDVAPTKERLEWTFSQCQKYGMDGVYIGVMENLSNNGELSELGKQCNELIRNFSKKLQK
jgi:hypothetical protein